MFKGGGLERAGGMRVTIDTRRMVWTDGSIEERQHLDVVMPSASAATSMTPAPTPGVASATAAASAARWLALWLPMARTSFHPVHQCERVTPGPRVLAGSVDPIGTAAACVAAAPSTCDATDRPVRLLRGPED
jgi:hypothetical protein